MRTDSRVAAFPAEREKQEDDLIFHGLVASGVKPRRNPWAAFGAVVFQSLLLLTLVVAPLFHTEKLPKRETLMMLYAPPPPAAASAATRLRTPTPTPTYISTSAIPAPVRKTEETPPTPVGSVGGVVGGVPGGVIGGVLGGVLSDVLNSTHSAVPVLAKTPAPAPKRVHLAPQIAEANLIHDVTPTYPPEAGRARIQGAVVLLAMIGKDGSVQDVRVESGLPVLAQAAIDAVRQWRYRPYLLNGEPVEVDLRIVINFALS